MIEKYLLLIHQSIQERRRARIKNTLVVEFNFVHPNLVEFTNIQPANEYFPGDIPRLPCKTQKSIVVVLSANKQRIYSASKFNQLLDDQELKIC